MQLGLQPFLRQTPQGGSRKVGTMKLSKEQVRDALQHAIKRDHGYMDFCDGCNGLPDVIEYITALEAELADDEEEIRLRELGLQETKRPPSPEQQ